MAEPECDDAGIDTGVEQSHRGRVPQDMGGNVFIGQARTARGGGAGVDGDAVFDGVSTEALAGAPGENHWRVGGASFLLPIAQRSDCFGGQRGDAVFPSLAAAGQVSAGAEVDIAHGEAEHLRDTESGLDGDEQESVVAPPGPGVAIRRCEQSFAFLVVEIIDKVTINALRRDCQHTGEAGGMFGMAKGRVTEQAVNPAESGVSGPGAIAAVLLQVVQEVCDVRGIEVVPLQRRRRHLVLVGGEDQQQAHRVTVGGDGVTAGILLSDQAVGEKRLQGGIDARHDRSSYADRRPAAAAMSSGEADKYQYVAAGSTCPR